MQKEKLFNKLCFVVPPIYNGYDMSQCTVTMRYLMPISREFVTETLVLSKEKYKEHLMYVLPIDTNLSKEHGDIELNLTFTMLDVDDNGDIIQRVRKTDSHMLHITKLPNWDAFVPDSALSALDQRILKQDAQIKALASLAISIDSNKVDGLLYDDKEETIQVSANGIGIGNKVSVRDMLDEGIPVVDLDSEDGSGSDNGSDVENNNSCDCGDCNCENTTEENNVVEF
jgi:hypothetical protein